MIDNNKVVQELNRMVCSTHGKRAEATIRGGQIAVSACCDSFDKQISKAIENAVSKQINDSVTKAFKGG